MLAGQLVLAVCYGLVCLGCAWQVAVIWFHGHMLRSYRVGFLSLSGFWTVLRAAFWLNSSREAVVLMVIFDWMPTAGQLASYMLFLVFCEKQVHPRQWGRRSCRCWLMCGGATLASVATIIGLGVLAGVDSAGSAAGGLSSGDGCQRHDDCRLSSTEEVLGAVFAAVVYCALSSCLGVYAWLIWRQAQDSRANKVSFRTGFVKKDQKASGIVPVLGVAALIFGGRTIYVTLLAAGVASPVVISALAGGPKQASSMAFAVPYYLGVDLLPTMLLLLYFRAIPRKPPRPRHIPETARGDDGGGINVPPPSGVTPPAADVTWHPAADQGRGGQRSSVMADTASSQLRHSRASDGRSSGSGPAASAAVRAPAFDPFNSDGDLLPRGFGVAPRTMPY